MNDINLQSQTSYHHDRLLSLAQIANSILGKDHIDNLIDLALEFATKQLGYSYAGIYKYIISQTEVVNNDPTGDNPGFEFVLHDEAGGETGYFVELPYEILKSAIITNQIQIIPTPHEGTSESRVFEIAIPLISAAPKYRDGLENLAGLTGAVLYTRFTANATTYSGDLSKLPLAKTMEDFTAIFPLSEIQILAAMLRLGESDSSSTRATPPTVSGQDYLTTDGAPVSSSLEPKGAINVNVERRLLEYESLWKIHQAIAGETDLPLIYQLIYDQLTQIMGEFSSFTIGLYSQNTDRLHFPFVVENGKPISVPACSLGRGPSSIVIHTGQPLLLAHNITERVREIGAIIDDETIKSWLGVPLSVQGEAIGLIIVKEINTEGRFGEGDQRLLNLVAAELAIAIRNSRLMEGIRRQTSAQRQIIEITEKIRHSNNVQAILKTTADELVRALSYDSEDRSSADPFYHASIRLYTKSEPISPSADTPNILNPQETENGTR